MEGIRRCSGCMGEMSTGQFCPHCGYNNNEVPENPIFIKPGTVINEYLFGKVLGHGGFGITYLGYDHRNDRRVAIKEYLPSELATRRVDTTEVTIFTGEKEQSFKSGIEKFKKEAQMLGNFKDFPGIVDAYDLFEANNTAYFVMEYVEGITLKEYMDQKGGRLPFETVRAILMPVIDALAEMHRKEILHRDISPDNIYITGDKHVKLLDFGAARQTAQAQNKGLSVILKHGFTPKEQYFTKGNQGPWTDVYALGATAYYMMTGTVPQPALDRLESDKLVPLTSFVPGMSPQVDGVIRKALAVEEVNRFQSVHDFKQALLNPEAHAPMAYNQPVQQAPIPPTPSVQPVQQPVYAQQGVQQPAYMQPNYQSPGAQQPVKKGKGLLILGILLPCLLVVIVGVVVLLMMKTVPDVEGDMEEDATEALEDAGFDYDIEYEFDDKAEFGEVLEQEPQAGKKTFNKNVQLVISKGPEEVEVPGVVGSTEDEATEALKKLGFKVTSELVYSSEPEGVVTEQSVEKGEVIENGSKITLSVSQGPDPNGVSFEDENLKAAVIEALGLSIEETGAIQLSDIEDVTTLDVSYYDITSLEGIEAFSNLEFLYASGNSIEEIPNLPKSLTTLDVAYNLIETLDVSDYTDLDTLYADGNYLTEIPSLPQSIEYLYLSYNEITDISGISGLSNLVSLDVSYNQINDFGILEGMGDQLWSIYTEGNPGTYNSGTTTTATGEEWITSFTQTYGDNDIISTYDDHANYSAFITYTLTDITNEEDEIYYGPYQMGDTSYELYYFEYDNVTVDFYLDPVTETTVFYDVYGDSYPLLGDQVLCGVDTYQSLVDLLGDPGEVYDNGDIIFVDYRTPDCVYSFVLSRDGTINMLRVFNVDFYYGQ